MNGCGCNCGSKSDINSLSRTIDIYDIWLREGNVGSRADFLNWLKSGATGPVGPKGNPGPQGAPGNDGISTYDTLKLGLPTIVNSEQDYVNILAKLITQEEIVPWTVTNTNGTTTVVNAPVTSPPIVNNSGTTNPNNLPKGGYFNFSVNADAATGVIIGNLGAQVSGEGPFTFQLLKSFGTPAQVTLFTLEPNGNVKVVNAAALLAAYTPGVATGPSYEYQVLDKYGTPSSLNPVAGGYKFVISIMPPAAVPYVGYLNRDFSVKSDQPANTVVGSVVGNDRLNNPMVYTISDTTNFNINSSTGEISTKTPSYFIYNPDVAPSANIRHATVNVSNGTNSVNVTVSVTIVPVILSSNQEITISSNGRSILSTLTSPSATVPGLVYVDAYGAERANVDYEYTITKSNANGDNLGVLLKRLVSGPIPTEISIETLMQYDQDKVLGPYDQITEFVFGVGTAYGTAHRAQYNATPFSVNGVFGPPIPPGGVNFVTLTRELT